MAKSPKTLSKFTVEPRGEDFSFHIEDDGGETLEFQATRDQLEVIVETLEEMLDDDDADDA